MCDRPIETDVLPWHWRDSNNLNDEEKHPHRMRTLRWARHLRKDGSQRLARKKTKKLKKAIGPIMEVKKTKMLAEIYSFKSDSNGSNDGLFGRNFDTSHVKALNDSSYFEGDEWSIEKTYLWATKLVFTTSIEFVVEKKKTIVEKEVCSMAFVAWGQSLSFIKPFYGSYMVL